MKNYTARIWEEEYLTLDDVSRPGQKVVETREIDFFAKNFKEAAEYALLVAERLGGEVIEVAEMEEEED